MVKQCPTCGTINKNWDSRAEGLKLRQREDIADRSEVYREWRRTWGVGAVCDLDQVEWRKNQPIGIIEITRIDGNVKPPKTYFDAILTRFRRDGQDRRAMEVAKYLKVKAWITAFRHDLSELWVYNLTDKRGWWHMTPDKYKEWLTKLKEK